MRFFKEFKMEIVKIIKKYQNKEEEEQKLFIFKGEDDEEEDNFFGLFSFFLSFLSFFLYFLSFFLSLSLFILDFQEEDLCVNIFNDIEHYLMEGNIVDIRITIIGLQSMIEILRHSKFHDGIIPFCG